VCRLWPLDGKAWQFASLNTYQEVHGMEVALMIPCYIDSFYPQVGIATLELLERLKVNVSYPLEQTCCGQPMANSGCNNEARGTEEKFVRVFGDFEYIATPSGSCTQHIRNKFTAAPDSPARQRVESRAYDLVEFLNDILKIHDYPWATFERKVALHTSCSAILSSHEWTNRLWRHRRSHRSSGAGQHDSDSDLRASQAIATNIRRERCVTAPDANLYASPMAWAHTHPDPQRQLRYTLQTAKASASAARGS
jgi:hypothetical protein